MNQSRHFQNPDARSHKPETARPSRAAGSCSSRFALTACLFALVLLVASNSLQAASATWNGTTNATWSTTTNWSTSPVPGSGDTATFNNAGNGNTTISLGTGVTVKTILFDTSSAAAYTIGSGAVGSQTLTLNDSGAITVNSSVTNNELFNANVVLGTDGATASYTFTNDSTTGGQLLTIAGNISGGQTTGAHNTKTLTLAGAGNGVISGVISGDGGGSGSNARPFIAVAKTGAGAWTLSGANTYAGGTTLSAGTLNINNASAIGTGAFTINGGTIDNTTGAAIALSTNNAITIGGDFTFGGTNNLNFGTGTITNAGNRTITLNGSGSTLTFGGTMTNTANAVQTTTVNGAGNTFSLGGYALSNNATSRIDIINGTGNVSITGVISNGGTATASGLTYSGSGVLTLSGTNTFGGVLTIQSGTLSIATINNASANGVLGNSANAVVLGGTGTTGTLEYTDGTTSSTKKFTMASGGTGAFQIDTAGNTLTLSGVIDGSGALQKTGAGTLALTGSNTYSGGTTVSAGTLQLGNATALGSSSGSLTVDGGTLNMNGQNQTVGNLTGAGGTILNNATATNVTLTVGNGNNGGGNYQGVIANNTSGTGTVALTKTGSGTITLSGNNTYTGVTTVNGGTLLVNGNQSSATGNVSVNNSGTTLGGTGTIGGKVTVGSGAILLGGTGASTSETLTVSNTSSGAITLNDGSIVELALGASGAHSTLAHTGSGTISFSSTQAFTFIDLGAETTTYDNIITGTGLSSLDTSGWTITNIGWSGTFTLDGSGNIDLNVTAIPEPSTWLGAALALGAIGFTQRRRLICAFKRA